MCHFESGEMGMGATHSNELILARGTMNDSINTLNALVIKEPSNL